MIRFRLRFFFFSALLQEQRHPMDLLHKMSVRKANFCWLGDLEKMICPWKESVPGKIDNSECLLGSLE